MKRQLAMALGMAAAALTFGQGCLIVSGNGPNEGECYDDCYDYQQCETYCDPWECWEECWVETSCTVTCTESYVPPASSQCIDDLDCAYGELCSSGTCVDEGEGGTSGGAAGLCQTCESTRDCFEEDARCIRLNFDQTARDGEKICSRTCDDNNDCPTGFECINVSQEVGVPAQCLPLQGDDNLRTCNNAAALDCTQANDCGIGESCVNNECVAPTNAECTATQACPSGQECILHKCKDPNESECTISSDCSGGELCIDGSCEAQATSCVRNSECGGGACVNGECVDSCTQSSDCGTYEICRKASGQTTGLCEQIECRRSADCSPGNVCVEARCEAACATNGDCSAGYTCTNSGFCEEDPDVQCRLTAECARDEICDDGECKSGCSCNQDCGTGELCDLDSNTCFVPNTAPGAGGACDTSCDCPSGFSCNDGTCG